MRGIIASVAFDGDPTMITLHGFALSNYYNKVKLALLEKGVPFTEQFVHPREPSAASLAASPLGKVPFITLPDGRALCESQVIVDWLESAYPNPPLMPADPFAAAKVRELATFIDLHLELVVREIYAQAFFGGTVSEGTQNRVKKQLAKNIPAFLEIAKFAPYVAGPQFTLADCSAFASLALVGMATKAVFGEDALVAAGLDIKPYLKLIGERPSAQRVAADRKAATAAVATGAAAKPL
jgi:glutathione S-transferase